MELNDLTPSPSTKGPDMSEVNELTYALTVKETIGNATVTIGYHPDTGVSVLVVGTADKKSVVRLVCERPFVRFTSDTE